jgi:hypothetical protein
MISSGRSAVDRAGWGSVLVLVGMLVLYLGPMAVPALGQDLTNGETTSEQTGIQGCTQLTELARLGPTTSDRRQAFEVTQRSFRVTYEVEFSVPETQFRDFEIQIQDEFGLVESDSTENDGTFGFLVPEGPGSFEFVTDVEPENGAEYTVVVEECAQGGGTTTPPGTTIIGPGTTIVGTIPTGPLLTTGPLPVTGGRGVFHPATAVLLGFLLIAYTIVRRRR